ncbi:hypothetical protein CCR75_003664 [Bremia lactucae]|uniref:Cation efflux protein transmembrane domain-containing protein n=1 Tax=Bremia lactucae TaxID=4779 RepID=A0A976IHX0_BRELC|nr:hypothetical protein CCR75_003664 [Bremia lactucae]
MDSTPFIRGTWNVTKHAVAWASSSLLLLWLLHSRSMSTTSDNSFLAQQLLLQFVLHVSITRRFKFDLQPALLYAMHQTANICLIVLALRHFGLLFAFLLQHVEMLLMQVKQWLDTKERIGALLLLLGHVLVAGINANEYGALMYSLLLLGAALGLQLAAQSPMLRAGGKVSPPSIAGIMVVAVVLVLLMPKISISFQYTPFQQTVQDGGIKGTSVWYICLIAIALSHFGVVCLEKKKKFLSSRGQAKNQLIYSFTGMTLANFFIILEFGWFRGLMNALACTPILYFFVNQWQRITTSFRGKDRVYQCGYENETENSGLGKLAAKVLAVLWRRRASRQMLMFLSINIAFMFVELGVGLYTNSLGLLGDAGHMLFDNGALFIGLVASYIGQLPPNANFTYGYGRVEVLSGFLNSLLLLVVSFRLIIEAASRFSDPPEVTKDHLLLTSIVGLLVNLVGLFFFHDHVHGHSHGHDSTYGNCGSGHGHSHSHREAHGGDVSEVGTNSNMYGVYLHVMADTLGSLGVIVSSGLIELYDWHVADSVSSALISLLILGSTFPLLRDTARQLLQGAPLELQDSVNAALHEIQTSILGVERIALWNIWHHAGSICVATLHLEVATSADEQRILQQTRSVFRRHAQLDKFLSVQILKPQMMFASKVMKTEHATINIGCSANYEQNSGGKSTYEIHADYGI